MRQVVPEHLKEFLPPSEKGITMNSRVVALEVALWQVLKRLSELEGGVPYEGSLEGSYDG